MKFKFSQQIFGEKTVISSSIEVSRVGAELFHAHRQTEGRTDGHDAANSRFPQFCERA
jgi:hypothetical protein